MSSSVITALIAALATIVAAIIPRVLDNLRYAPLVHKRQNQLKGSWRGTTTQSYETGNKQIVVELTIEMRSTWRKVSMDALVKGGGTELKVRADGGFIWGDYIKLDYESKDPAIKNFGSMILHLHANGKSLKGRMIGFGSESEQLVHGSVVLEKILD
jgi:hypothetical protein